MSKVAIVGYGHTKFSKEDLKIESVLCASLENGSTGPTQFWSALAPV